MQIVVANSTSDVAKTSHMSSIEEEEDEEKEEKEEEEEEEEAEEELKVREGVSKKRVHGTPSQKTKCKAMFSNLW